MKRLKAATLGATLLILAILLPPKISDYRIDGLPETENWAVKSVINDFTRTDRCDPLPCLDHFWFKSISRLTEEKAMRNTGGAKISTECNSAYFIESDKSIQDGVPQCICSKGSLYLELWHGSWVELQPLKGTLQICYR